MKLTKPSLLATIKESIEQLDYQYINDSLTGADGLFIKVVKERYFLSLGLTISNRYDARFTASFYLSKTTRWGSVWGDIPLTSYARISRFLTTEQRASLLSEEFNGPNVIDGWWNFNVVELKNFLTALEVSELAFLRQNELFNEIEKSSVVKKQEENALAVKELVNKFNYEYFDYKFIPTNPIDGIPMEWFKAAEQILKKSGDKINLDTVKLLASDAWRQKLVRNQEKA